jgi:hypothetical protein
MTDEQQPRRRGRPATGVTTKRNVRIGAEWDRAERLAAQLAEREGAKVNVTAYVEAALKRENDRVERLLKRSTQ